MIFKSKKNKIGEVFAKKEKKEIVKVAGEAVTRKRFVLYIKSCRIAIANIKKTVNFDNDLQVENF